jgi:hypothetical protein
VTIFEDYFLVNFFLFGDFFFKITVNLWQRIHLKNIFDKMEKIEHCKEVHRNQPFFYRRILAKIWFQPIGRIFHEKNGPNSLDSKNKFLPMVRFLLLVPVGSQKYRKIYIFSYFHITTCGQIWLITFEMIATSTTSQNWKKKPW